MKDLHYRPACENKLPAAIVTIMCALALFCLVLAASGIGYTAVFHALVLLFGSVAIFFAYRYYLSYRTYHLTKMAGRRVLTVTDTQGKRITTVFYLYLDEVENAELIARTERKKLEKKEKTFVFSNTLRAQRLLCINAETELGKIRLLLGANESFALAFGEALTLARTESEQKGHEEAE